MLKLLIFDLDGTLADTGRDIAEAINFAIAPFGVSSYSVEEVKAMVGSGISYLLRSIAPSGSESPGVQEKVIARFFRHYSLHLLDHTRAYPGVPETLQQLTAYRKTVLSNKREEFSRRILNGLGLSSSFDAAFGSDSLSEKKPSPAPVLEILDRFGVSRDETVIVGDSSYDIEAGNAAGVRSIAVTYGFRSRETLKDADSLIDSFRELATILPAMG